MGQEVSLARSDLAQLPHCGDMLSLGQLRSRSSCERLSAIT